MRLLLDTHALIWAVQSPERLGAHARAALVADGAEVYASHVSLWEMAIKRSIGRLDQLDRKAVDWFDHFVPRSGLRQLPIAPNHLGAVEDLPRLHHDPFDRLLVTQARREGMTIVTLDSHVRQYDVDVIW
jgi:PIN domain nuclease of toxin-antitoxin system